MKNKLTFLGCVLVAYAKSRGAGYGSGGKKWVEIRENMQQVCKLLNFPARQNFNKLIWKIHLILCSMINTYLGIETMFEVILAI